MRNTMCPTLLQNFMYVYHTVTYQIGVSRLQKQSEEKTNIELVENTTASKSGLVSNTALVNFCDSAFLRTKRKLNPEGQKVLTIDSDCKLKKASAVNSESKSVGFATQALGHEPR